jgi:hypothetical protein
MNMEVKMDMETETAMDMYTDTDKGNDMDIQKFGCRMSDTE